MHGLLRLATVTLKALPRVAAATLSGSRVFFDVSCGGRHGALLASVGVCGGNGLSKRTRHMPPRVCENGVTSASRAPNTSCFLLLTRCGIRTPKRPVPFPHRLLHAASA
jgi:hypothetical protein